jgi:hypothetical protein
MMNEPMPPVSKCDVTQCFYNRDAMCHAPAINVGGEHPMCDTFITANNHIPGDQMSAVGACHVAQCEYNQDLTCRADGILVGLHNNHADCFTYEPR